MTVKNLLDLDHNLPLVVVDKEKEVEMTDDTLKSKIYQLDVKIDPKDSTYKVYADISKED